MCVTSFERPESWEDDLYAVVYAARHELIRHLDAIMFVFDEPLELHLWDGWVRAEGLEQSAGRYVPH